MSSQSLPSWNEVDAAINRADSNHLKKIEKLGYNPYAMNIDIKDPSKYKHLLKKSCEVCGSRKEKDLLDLEDKDKIVRICIKCAKKRNLIN